MFDFNDREMVTAKLQELLDRNIPVMTLEKLLHMKEYKYLKVYVDKATDEEVKGANAYFASYCKPEYNDGKDIFSDERCMFYWGLKHGEMTTNDNGMDRTYYHYLTLAGERHRIEMLLQYHPSVYSVN